MPIHDDNPFASMIAETGVKKTDVVDSPKPKKEDPKKSFVEKDAKFLFRLNGNFYKEVQMFAKIKGESVNTIIEMALMEYLNNKDNFQDYKKAKSIAEQF